MKYLLLLFVSFSSFLPLYSEEPLTPLWEEGRHFIYYRSLFISTSIHRIEELLEFISEGNEEVLRDICGEIAVIKYSLGELANQESAKAVQ